MQIKPLANSFNWTTDVSTKKILYVDDHPATRQVMIQMLESVGFNIAVAEDGREGVEKARCWQPHIILMDLRMPHMDGFEAIKIIRAGKETAHIPIIVISGWANARHKERTLAVGANEHFSKPILFKDLMALLHRYLEPVND